MDGEDPVCEVRLPTTHCWDTWPAPSKDLLSPGSENVKFSFLIPYALGFPPNLFLPNLWDSMSFRPLLFHIWSTLWSTLLTRAPSCPEHPQMVSGGTGEGWKSGIPITTPTQFSKSSGTQPSWSPFTYLSTYCGPEPVLRMSPVTLTSINEGEFFRSTFWLGKLRTWKVRPLLQGYLLS